MSEEPLWLALPLGAFQTISSFLEGSDFFFFIQVMQLWYGKNNFKSDFKKLVSWNVDNSKLGGRLEMIENFRRFSSSDLFPHKRNIQIGLELEAPYLPYLKTVTKLLMKDYGFLSSSLQTIGFAGGSKSCIIRLKCKLRTKNLGISKEGRFFFKKTNFDFFRRHGIQNNIGQFSNSVDLVNRLIRIILQLSFEIVIRNDWMKKHQRKDGTFHRHKPLPTKFTRQRLFCSYFDPVSRKIVSPFAAVRMSLKTEKKKEEERRRKKKEEEEEDVNIPENNSRRRTRRRLEPWQEQRIRDRISQSKEKSSNMTIEEYEKMKPVIRRYGEVIEESDFDDHTEHVYSIKEIYVMNEEDYQLEDSNFLIFKSPEELVYPPLDKRNSSFGDTAVREGFKLDKKDANFIEAIYTTTATPSSISSHQKSSDVLEREKNFFLEEKYMVKVKEYKEEKKRRIDAEEELEKERMELEKERMKNIEIREELEMLRKSVQESNKMNEKKDDSEEKKDDLEGME